MLLRSATTVHGPSPALPVLGWDRQTSETEHALLCQLERSTHSKLKFYKEKRQRTLGRAWTRLWTVRQHPGPVDSHSDF